MCSIISEKPGPEVTVKALAPAHTMPCKVMEAANSSSIWINTPPTLGTREAKRSTTSVEGVMGYPAAHLLPAANAPSQQAWSPSMKCMPVRTPRGSAFIWHLPWRDQPSSWEDWQDQPCWHKWRSRGNTFRIGHNHCIFPDARHGGDGSPWN